MNRRVFMKTVLVIVGISPVLGIASSKPEVVAYLFDGRYCTPLSKNFTIKDFRECGSSIDTVLARYGL